MADLWGSERGQPRVNAESCLQRSHLSGAGFAKSLLRRIEGEGSEEDRVDTILDGRTIFPAFFCEQLPSLTVKPNENGEN